MKLLGEKTNKSGFGGVSSKCLENPTRLVSKMCWKFDEVTGGKTTVAMADQDCHSLWKVSETCVATTVTMVMICKMCGKCSKTAGGKTTMTMMLYAVKVQRSLAPLSRFRGSHITTAHEQQCCRFQSYANSVPSPMKLTKREPHSWDPRQRTTSSRLVTFDFNSVLSIYMINFDETSGEKTTANGCKFLIVWRTCCGCGYGWDFQNM